MPSPIVVEGLWVPDRNAVPDRACDRRGAALRQISARVVADGADGEAARRMSIAAWLPESRFAPHRAAAQACARVGGLGLPHAETHAIILPHVNASIWRPRPTLARGWRLRWAMTRRPCRYAARLPIPQTLSEVGFDRANTDFVAEEIAGLTIACAHGRC